MKRDVREFIFSYPTIARQEIVCFIILHEEEEEEETNKQIVAFQLFLPSLPSLLLFSFNLANKDHCSIDIDRSFPSFFVTSRRSTGNRGILRICLLSKRNARNVFRFVIGRIVDIVGRINGRAFSRDQNARNGITPRFKTVVVPVAKRFHSMVWSIVWNKRSWCVPLEWRERNGDGREWRAPLFPCSVIAPSMMPVSCRTSRARVSRKEVRENR